MKKNFSKTIMIIVAVLLTLVLISTSTVSGIFAKYVVTKDATTIVSLKKFGVKLKLVTGANYDSTKMSMDPASLDDTTLSVTVTLSLAPGDDYKEIIKFVPSVDPNGATVDTNIKVKATVEALENCDYTTTSYYVPVGFYANKGIGDDNRFTISDPFITNSGEEALKSGLETNLNNGIRDKILGLANTATPDSNGFYAKELVSAGEKTPSISTIGFGVYCPETVNSPTNADVIMTQLAEQGATVRVKYTVSLEQK